MSGQQMSAEAYDILARATCEASAVRIPAETIPRVVYDEVNEVLVRLGGKWKSGGKHPDGTPKGKHVFPYDPAPLLAAVVASGEMPPKNPTAFFPTPPSLVEMMVEACGLAHWPEHRPLRVLEPSGGTGAIAEAIRRAAPDAHLDVVEMLAVNASVLRAKGFTVHEGDFLSFTPDAPYDYVLMNPPFSVAGDAVAWLTHVMHAWEMLSDTGELVAIVPHGFTFRGDAKHSAFRALADECGDWEEIPAGTFKESGTGIATVLVHMKRENRGWKDKPHKGWPSWNSFQLALWAENDRPTYDRQQVAFKEMADGDATADAARDRMRRLWKDAAADGTPEGVHVTLSAADMEALVDHALEEYREWREWNGLPASAWEDREPIPIGTRTASDVLDLFDMAEAA